jgi:DNA-binding PucR family transcriptional regulator
LTPGWGLSGLSGSNAMLSCCSHTRAVALRPLSARSTRQISPATWVWIPGNVAPDERQLANAIDPIPGVRIAIGSTAAGVEGFRRSHLDAITTQRMLARLQSAQRIASFQTVQLVSLVTQDLDRVQEFIANTLGELESANLELRSTVRTFVNEQCNASRAARTLYTHRNTLLRRLARADQLLPRPLEENSVNVAVALEVLHWRAR